MNIRYRDDLPLVLKHLSFTIEPKEKVGIVGRTGSGKSSLILALKRILEVDPKEQPKGEIKLDGRVLEDLGLWACRRAMNLIHQDPFLLKGSVKFNIDPFDQHTQEEVLKVLKETMVYESLVSTIRRIQEKKPEAQNNLSHLKENYVEKNKEHFEEVANSEKEIIVNKPTHNNISDEEVINFEIEESGSNLSQGQK